jgi:GNAT superfamily N-acetyltransferase
MDDAHYVELEAAAFKAWPALLAEEIFLGWRLRFSGGTTKRTNSANAGLDAADLDSDQILEIERRYRQRGLPVIFRITSVATPRRIDRVLEQRGYRRVDPTWVMTAPMSDDAARGEPPRLLEPEAWLDCCRQVTGSAGADLSTQLIRSGNDASAFAVEELDGDPACCGIGVVSNGNLGLFALATARAHQRKGLATTLCRTLLHWGHRHGAVNAYLQVVQSNAGAIRIYEKLGFTSAYGYWYRVSS